MKDSELIIEAVFEDQYREVRRKETEEGISEVEQYLKATPIIDCNHKTIQKKADEVTKRQEAIVEKASRLFYFVRDEIKYNPYLFTLLPEHLRASATLKKKEGFCVQKAVLLAALARAIGIPTRLRFVDLKNHLAPRKLLEIMHTDIFLWHGYNELYINGKWLKATPAFDIEMCKENQIIPVEFDGKNDAKFHSRTQDGKLHIEYLLDRGSYEDVPLNEIRKWLTSVLKPEAKSKILGNDSL